MTKAYAVQKELNDLRREVRKLDDGITQCYTASHHLLITSLPYPEEQTLNNEIQEAYRTLKQATAPERKVALEKQLSALYQKRQQLVDRRREDVEQCAGGKNDPTNR